MVWVCSAPHLAFKAEAHITEADCVRLDPVTGAIGFLLSSDNRAPSPTGLMS